MQSTRGSASAPTRLHAVLSIVIGHQTVPDVSLITHPIASVDFKYTLVDDLTDAHRAQARHALSLFQQSLARVPVTDLSGARENTLCPLLSREPTKAAEEREKGWQARFSRITSDSHETFKLWEVLGWQVFTKDEYAFLTSKLTDGRGFILDQKADRGLALLRGKVRHTLPKATNDERDKGFGASPEAEKNFVTGRLSDDL